MPAAELPTLALAAFRITRLAVVDSLLEEPRERLHTWLADKPGGPKILQGLSCTWCAGVWISAATYTAWVLTDRPRRRRPLARHVIAVAAVAGAQGLLHSWEGE